MYNKLNRCFPNKCIFLEMPWISNLRIKKLKEWLERRKDDNLNFLNLIYLLIITINILIFFLIKNELIYSIVKWIYVKRDINRKIRIW